MGESTGLAGSGAGYAAQVATLRSAAKWLLAAAAGVGAILLGGVQITGIGGLPVGSARFCLAAAGATLALLAVGYMIWQASAVLTEEWLTLTSFSDEHIDRLLSRKRKAQRIRQIREIAERIDDSRQELFAYAASSLGDLHRRLREQQEDLHRADLSADARTAAEHRAAVLRAAANDVAQCANYYLTRDLFSRMRTRLGLASVVVVLGMAAFAYATTPPKSTEPIKIEIAAAATPSDQLIERTQCDDEGLRPPAAGHSARLFGLEEAEHGQVAQ